MANTMNNYDMVSPYIKADYNNRIVWLDTDVDSSWLMCEQLIFDWNKQDDEIPDISAEQRLPIKLLFYSDGGDIDMAISLIPIIENSVTPIYGYNMGVCLSAACCIYMACHKRFALPHSKFLIHQGTIDNFSGTYSELASTTEVYKKDINFLYDYIEKRTNLSSKTLKQHFTKEWYLYAEEAVQYDICNAVVTKINDIV